MAPRTPLNVAFDKPWPTTRRGFKLWLLSIIIGLKGLGYVRGQTSDSTESALRLITDQLHIPLVACGYGIVALCVFSIVCSYCHHGRDRYGYSALTAFSFSWAAVFAIGTLFFDAPSYAWQGTLSYALFGVFLILSADDDQEPQANGICR